MPQEHSHRRRASLLVAAAIGLFLALGCTTGGHHDPPWRIAPTWSAPVDDVGPSHAPPSTSGPIHNPSGAADSARETPSPPAADPGNEARNQLFAEHGSTPASNRRPTPPSDKPWHLDFSVRGSHTKLAGTEELLNRRLELPLAVFDVYHIFHDPYTPLDRRDDMGMLTFNIGGGRQETDWLVWNFYFGGGTATDHDHQRFLNYNLEIEFTYEYFYAGATAEIYPLKVPRPGDRMTWYDPFRLSRPFVVTGLETGCANGKGSGHYSIAPVILYRDHETIRDWVTSYIIGLGWSIPMHLHWSLNLAGDYRFHFYRPEEYDGWTASLALRYNF